MDLKQQAWQIVGQVALERPGKGKSYEGWAEALQVSGQKIQGKLAMIPPSYENRRVVRHMIGIERWGQSRLRVLLGHPLVIDEYNGYRPPRATPWDALRDEFAATRGETVDLARRLAWSPVTFDTVPHNDVGPLTARGWLAYLDGHARRESRKLN